MSKELPPIAIQAKSVAQKFGKKSPAKFAHIQQSGLGGDFSYYVTKWKACKEGLKISYSRIDYDDGCSREGLLIKRRKFFLRDETLYLHGLFGENKCVPGDWKGKLEELASE